MRTGRDSNRISRPFFSDRNLAQFEIVGEAVSAAFSSDSEFQLVRIAYLTPPEAAKAGILAMVSGARDHSGPT